MIKKRKSLIIVFLCIVMCVSVTGCKDKNINKHADVDGIEIYLNGGIEEPVTRNYNFQLKCYGNTKSILEPGEYTFKIEESHIDGSTSIANNSDFYWSITNGGGSGITINKETGVLKIKKGAKNAAFVVTARCKDKDCHYGNSIMTNYTDLSSFNSSAPIGEMTSFGGYSAYYIGDNKIAVLLENGDNYEFLPKICGREGRYLTMDEVRNLPESLRKTFTKKYRMQCTVATLVPDNYQYKVYEMYTRVKEGYFWLQNYAFGEDMMFHSTDDIGSAGPIIVFEF